MDWILQGRVEPCRAFMGGKDGARQLVSTCKVGQGERTHDLDPLLFIIISSKDDMYNDDRLNSIKLLSKKKSIKLLS